MTKRIKKPKTLLFTVLLVALSAAVHALPPDPEVFEAIRTARNLINFQPGDTTHALQECVTDDLTILAQNWTRLPEVYRQELQGIFLRPGLPGSAYGSIYLPEKFDTPHFRLHYTTAGPHAVPPEDIYPMNGVPDYVDVCAEACERSFHVEVDLMGFKQPLDDFWVAENGGDHRYDVYLFAFPALGFTTADWYSGRVLSTVATLGPYFAINSRIYDYFARSEGIRFIETTMAHEFLHGIQFAYNAFMPTWFMEASATWVESKVYDGGRVEDLDDIPDPDELGEADAYNYYSGQLRRWLLQPDIALDSRFEDHEYGSVIWVFYMSERFNVDMVRQVYANATEGSFREFGNFSQVFTDQGTTLAEAFKTFTVWNYFTYDRDDGQHYFNGHRFPPVAIHLSDIHRTYPVRVNFDSESMPEAFSSRYVVFEPIGVTEKFAVKIDGADLAPVDMNTLSVGDRAAIQDELDRLAFTGLRGWGAKFLVEKSDGTVETREAFTYQRSQEAQITFDGFGDEIRKITLIVINMRPDVEHVVVPGGEFFGGAVSYMAGAPPTGRLSTPRVSQRLDSGVIVEWELEDLTDIREVAIVRKRFSSQFETDEPRPFQSGAEVLNAADRDGNGIPEDDVNIVGRVSPTQTTFEDKTIFQDVDTSSIDPQDTRYYYAVVPINDLGLMGTPSIDTVGITPVFNATLQATQAPAQTRLLQSYPNPFNPEVWMPYELGEDAQVSIEIYDLAGRLTRTLDLGLQSAGRYTDKQRAAYWDGRTQSGERAASGVYFYVLRAGEFVSTRKMAVLK